MIIANHPINFSKTNQPKSEAHLMICTMARQFGLLARAQLSRTMCELHAAKQNPTHLKIIMDLNIIVEQDGVRDSDQIIQQKIDKCRMLGFTTIAVSVVINIENKSPQVPPPPRLDTLTKSSLKVYTRLTAKISDTLELYKLGKCKETARYDLLALEPQNGPLLQHICGGSTQFDILTFNLTDRLDFNIAKVGLKDMLDKGVCIEINYGPAQLASSSRRNIICNGQSLIEKTTRNIILSSGVTDVFRLRTPKDAKHVGALFMLAANKCYEAVYSNGCKALEASKHRKNPVSSAIEQVPMEAD